MYLYMHFVLFLFHYGNSCKVLISVIFAAANK